MKRILLALFFCVAGAGAAFAQPVTTGSRDISGTVTLGGTYQEIAPTSTSRKNCTVQNPGNASEVLNVKLGTMAQPFVLNAGQSFSTLNGVVGGNDSITVTAATTGHAFAGTCQ